MNPELWMKDYDYSFEEREVKQRFLKFFEGLTQARRITHDPFQNTSNIRCTFSGCKQRYAISGMLLQNLAENQPKDIFRFTAGIHEHFLTELSFQRIGTTSASTMCKNGKELFICESCGYAPFPKPMGMRTNWEHTCSNYHWALDLGKPNIMTWRINQWILQVNYVHRTWHWLSQQSGKANYDAKNSCWLIADSFADEVEKACKLRYPGFKKGNKPAARPGARPGMVAGNLNVRKLQAANDIVSIIAKAGAFRAVQSRLHPDRFTNPTEKAQATKDFQELQEAWNKWEKA